MRLLGICCVLAGSLLACGDETSASASADTTSSGAGGSGASGGVDDLPTLSADTSGIFADGSVKLAIGILTRNCGGVGATHCPDNDPGAPELYDNGIDIQLSDMTGNELAITSVTVTADDEPVPMVEYVYGWQSDYDQQSRPIAQRYGFAVEAGPGNTLENLVYETSVLPPHRITAPEPGAILSVGQDVTVEWEPSDPILAYRVDLAAQRYEENTMLHDPGTFVLPGNALGAPQPDRLTVQRIASQTIEDHTLLFVSHAHEATIDVVVE